MAGAVLLCHQTETAFTDTSGQPLTDVLLCYVNYCSFWGGLVTLILKRGCEINLHYLITVCIFIYLLNRVRIADYSRTQQDYVDRLQ